MLQIFNSETGPQKAQNAARGDFRSIGELLHNLVDLFGAGKTAVAAAGAATLNSMVGEITTEALTTAAGAIYTLTLTSDKIRAGDIAFASVGNGTNTAGEPSVLDVEVNNNQIKVRVKNVHASAALNGTLTVAFHALRG